jgi:hypothetical protein
MDRFEPEAIGCRPLCRLRWLSHELFDRAAIGCPEAVRARGCAVQENSNDGFD